MSQTPGAFQRLWYRWKMLRLPWRRKWLVGFDLKGNTFYEFRDPLPQATLSNTPLRNRRILQPRQFTHHSDVKIAPQWQQWLRHTRIEPPTLQELQMDVARQEQIKVLAARADERWQNAKRIESGEDQRRIGEGAATGEGVAEVRTEVGEQPSGADRMRQDEGEPAPVAPAKKSKTKKDAEAPWNQGSKGNPGDAFQPEGWTPAPARRK
ncbi:hypothetical protein M011DRAFT_470235 [Sporormia fimetaria CBS 119925]|uniref:Uncharacterized protein n=1 Tax=Sporormia fimetaria CBS 119925 TaxID=1340428 RepID=A0A6A6V2E4_9PLEO|nr:hypothetical protein M011DRAFT_470235 [Sporormia fimetaria CBS 119925]